MPDPQNNDPQTHDDDQLIVRYLDGQLDEQQFAEFNNRLKGDATLRHRFIELTLHTHHLQAYLEKPDLGLVQEELLHQQPGRPPMRLALPTRVYVGIGVTLAAVLALAITLTIVMSGSPVQPTDPGFANDSPSKPVATLTNTHHATWAEGALAPGSPLRAGQHLTLTKGYAEITTNRGAIAILEAPASIELTDNDNAIELYSGKLVGICETEASKGFVVRTPHMDITDLGTRFGVEVNDQGDVYTAVFDGEVVVASNRHSGDQRHTTLHAGKALRVIDSSEQEHTPHALGPDHAFLPSWRDVQGRVQLSGQARFFVTPPKDLRPNALIDPEYMIVFQEQTAVTDRAIPVLTEVSKASKGNMRATVPEGKRVISYMIHFSPSVFIEGSNDNSKEPRSVVARLQFPGRVLGLVTGNADLAATDALLGLDSVAYMGTDYNSYNNAIDGWPGDGLKITGQAQDTLEIKLSALVHSDQARVLVEAPFGSTTD